MFSVVFLNSFRPLAPRTGAGTSSRTQSRGRAPSHPSPPARGCEKPCRQQRGCFLKSLLRLREYIGGWARSRGLSGTFLSQREDQQPSAGHPPSPFDLPLPCGRQPFPQPHNSPPPSVHGRRSGPRCRRGRTRSRSPAFIPAGRTPRRTPPPAPSSPEKKEGGRWKGAEGQHRGWRWCDGGKVRRGGG